MEQKQAPSYTNDMMKLLSFMMESPCITPSEDSRKTIPNRPLAPMYDLTSTIANLQVYDQGPKGVMSTFKERPLSLPSVNCNIVIEDTTINEQKIKSSFIPKPRPISLQKRDYQSMLLNARSPNVDLDFSLSPSLTFLSPLMSPIDMSSMVSPNKKKFKITRSPLYDSHDLFSVLVDICDGQNQDQDELFNMGNN
ncbi:hypothetical protein AKO1_002501 [Acrasis kona]|uniref:Uncharacterized protein n=1 Tax=Acrasis kona TaxID=1008807 RepID=A0AAW2ZNJ9_9EUKA